MSADNGIYILITMASKTTELEVEYRVRELQAVENLEYDENAPMPTFPKKGEYHSVFEYRPKNRKHIKYQKEYYRKYHSNNPDVHIRNARTMWKDCEVFYTREAAFQEACRLETEIANSDFPVLEYGISFIRIPRIF